MVHSLKTAALVASSLFLLAGPSAFASESTPGGLGIHLMVERAELSDQQKAQVQALIAENASQQRALKRQSGMLRLQMADKMLTSSAPSASDFAALLEKDAQLHTQLQNLALQTALKIRAILTPVQVSRVAQVHAQLKAIDVQKQALMAPNEVAPIADEELR